MVIAHDIQKWLDKRRQKQLEAARAEGEAKGIAKGRNEERSLWQEWNARRLDAESRGENFTEPPPQRQHRLTRPFPAGTTGRSPLST